MLFLSRHKSNQTQDKEECIQDKIAECIEKGCVTAQEEVCKLFQDKFETLTITAKRVAVVAFCTLSFSICVFLFLKSFSKHPRHSFSITITSVPKQVSGGWYSAQAVNGITSAELDKIIKFRSYLDSLAKSPSGKRILDSIRMNRSGLIDSLTRLEDMYHLQSSNK